MSELSDLQEKIVQIRESRGFTTDPLKVFILLSEEVGEVATELKKTWSKNFDDFEKQKLEEEIADCFVLLSALASEFDIDIKSAVERKFIEKDAKRKWATAADSESL